MMHNLSSGNTAGSELQLRSTLNPHNRDAGDPYDIGDVYSRLRSKQWSPSAAKELKRYFGLALV